MSKKRKVAPVQMTMRESDIDYRRRLLVRWDYLCVICGREFANIACVTKEHIVPKSETKHPKGDENLAPSHHQCNTIRQTASIIETAKMIDAIERAMKPWAFHAWLNKPVPNRIVPARALRPPRVQRFMELPDTLPGMR